MDMMNNSWVRTGAPVQFPEWRGERHYMLPFAVGSALPSSVRRFQATVDAMLIGVPVEAGTEAFLMVDEGEVQPGTSHRRPGLHVDGYWHPAASCHGSGGGGGHGYAPPGHRSRSRHEYYPPTPDPKQPPAKAEWLALASSYASARALIGSYDRDFESDWRGGDCSEISLNGMSAVDMQAGVAYHMGVFSLHESLPVAKCVRRTLVRLNIPGVAS